MSASESFIFWMMRPFAEFAGYVFLLVVAAIVGGAIVSLLDFIAWIRAEKRKRK